MNRCCSCRSKGSNSAAEAEEIDALLAELDAPSSWVAEAACSGKKKKLKKVRILLASSVLEPQYALLTLAVSEYTSKCQPGAQSFCSPSK